MIKFTVLKTRLEVSPLFFAVLTAFLLMDKSGIAGEAVLFSILHELGHFFALLCAKTHPKAVELSVFGIHMSLPENLSTLKKCFVLMAGFAVNFILSAVLFSIGKPIAGFINLFIGIFTALPIAATDGGAVIKTIFENMKPEKAEQITKKISILFSAAVSIILIAVTIYTGNFYLLFAVSYIFILAIK